MLPALTHGPPTHVKASSEQVSKERTDAIDREPFAESVAKKVVELAIYSNSTCLENPIAKKKPPLPIEMWTRYHAAGEGVARINSVQARHYELK